MRDNTESPDEADARAGLWRGISNAALIMGGVGGMGVLIYFRWQIWAWVSGTALGIFLSVMVVLMAVIVYVAHQLEKENPN